MNDKSNRAKLPPTEYYLDAAVAAHEAMKRAGLEPQRHDDVAVLVHLRAYPVCLSPIRTEKTKVIKVDVLVQWWVIEPFLET